jgi:protein TonB
VLDKNIVKKTIPVVTGFNLKGTRTQPVYPKRAERHSQQGTVFIQVRISASGKQKDIKIVEGSKYPILDNAALEAVKQWEFEPTLFGGKTVESWLKVPVEFKII